MLGPRVCQYRRASGDVSARVAGTAPDRRVPGPRGESPAQVPGRSGELAEPAPCQDTTARIGTGVALTLDTTTTSHSIGDTASADTVRRIGVLLES